MANNERVCKSVVVAYLGNFDDLAHIDYLIQIYAIKFLLSYNQFIMSK